MASVVASGAATGAAPSASSSAPAPSSAAPVAKKVENKQEDMDNDDMLSLVSGVPGAGTSTLAGARTAGGAMSAFPSDKEDNLYYNVLDCAGFDISPVPQFAREHAQKVAEGKTSEKFVGTDEALKNYTRDNVQWLVNHLFHDLPLEKTESGIVGVMAANNHTVHSKLCRENRFTSLRLPRKLPLPKEKAMTRWEQFAKERGIQKQKRSRLVYDEISKDWVPRWGKGSIKKLEEERDYCREVKGDATEEESMADPWAKSKNEKKLQQAKQKMREMRNKVEGAGFKLDTPMLDASRRDKKAAGTHIKRGGTGVDHKNSGRGVDGLNEAARRALVNGSASGGRFDKNVKVTKDKRENAKLLEMGKATGGTGVGKNRRVKVDTRMSSGQEKEGYSKTFERLHRNDNKIDVGKAANFGQQSYEKDNKMRNKMAKKAKGGKGKKGKITSKNKGDQKALRGKVKKGGGRPK